MLCFNSRPLEILLSGNGFLQGGREREEERERERKKEREREMKRESE